MGVEPTYFWQQAMSLPAAFAWAFVFLAICYFLFNRIGPHERHGIETWMRWLCD
jgi:membrane protein DedA with SNARE-associated domain